MKRILPVLLAVLLLLGACSGGEEELEADVSADPDEPVLTRKDMQLTVWTDPGGEAFIEQAAAVFVDKYRRPNIKFKVEGMEPADLLSRVWAESARGGAADLFILPHTEIPQLAEALLILPAKDQSKTKNAVFTACAQSATVDGRIYGYPVSSETTALFYNKQLISESQLPGTWEEVSAENFQVPVEFPYTASFLLAMNNRPFGPNGDIPQILNLDNPRAIDGMTTFQRLNANGQPSGAMTLDAAERAFISGGAAMILSGPWSVARFVDARVDFGVAPLPVFPGEEQGASLAFTRVMAVSAWSEWADEASAFAALLLTEELQRLRIELTGEMPSVDMVMNSPFYAAGFIEQMKSAVPAPVLPQAAAYWAAFGQAAANIWDGQAVQAELNAAVTALRSVPEEPQAED
jgi:arabinogalactan oligomer/maltooligosaccharide transport system substrate-binding protein